MAVTQEEDGSWTAECERDGCGGFTTRNHPTKKAAQERLGQHDDEHEETLDAELRAMTKEN